MYLKFVDRLGHVPHDTLTLECDSVYKKQIIWGEGDTEFSELYIPFAEPKKGDVVMVTTVTGAPGYGKIAGSNMFLFVMNNEGNTIDKTVV